MGRRKYNFQAAFFTWISSSLIHPWLHFLKNSSFFSFTWPGSHSPSNIRNPKLHCCGPVWSTGHKNWKIWDSSRQMIPRAAVELIEVGGERSGMGKKNHLLNASSYCFHHQNSSYKRAGLESKLKLCSVEMLSLKSAVHHGKILIFNDVSIAPSLSATFALFLRAQFVKSMKGSSISAFICWVLQVPELLLAWIIHLWDCRTDLGSQQWPSATTDTLRVLHLLEEPCTSLAGEEKRFKNNKKQTNKKNPLEETHLKSFKPFYISSSFLPKQQILAMNIQTHPETDLLTQSPPNPTPLATETQHIESCSNLDYF